MAWSTEISQLVTETQQFIDAVELNKPTLDAAANTAVLNAASASVSAANTVVIATASTTSADVSKGHAVATEAIANLTKMQQGAVSDAERQASLAAGYALSAGAIVQQDLTGVTAAALHRSPNAVTSMFVYDTSKDSDGGAWTEKCQNTSWYNEDLSGKWLGQWISEFEARNAGATLGPELFTNGTFDTDVSGWQAAGCTVSKSGNVMRITDSDGGTGYAFKSVSLEIGKTYLASVEVTLDAITGALTLYMGTTSGSAQMGSSSLANGPGTISFFFTATATTGWIAIRNVTAVAGEYWEVDNVSVKEVTARTTASNDYFQLTTDGKFYRLWKNLLSNTELFTAAPAWQIGSNITRTTGYADPFGTMKAAQITAVTSGTTTSNYIRQFTALNIYSSGVSSVWVRRVTGTGRVRILNLANGTTGLDITTTISSSWTRVEFAGDAAGGYLYFGVGIETVGDVIEIAFPQLELGAIATTYEAKENVYGNSEVFRGNKRDFPRLAGIVSEGTNVNIYDLTEAGRPMWMRFVGPSASDMLSDGSSIPSGGSSVAMLNGIMAYASVGVRGPLRVNFITERAHRNFIYTNQHSGTYQGVIAERNAGKKFDNNGDGAVIHWVVNAIAMTVLPDAPTDLVTGLRVPTVAIATVAGVSIIRHDGVIRNSSSTSAFLQITLSPTLLSVINGVNAQWTYALNPGALGASFAMTALGASAPDYFTSTSVKQVQSSRSQLFKAANASLVSQLRFNDGILNRSIAAKISNIFNTGWMPGDIRRAYLSDVEVGSITGPELVTNGTFDTDTTRWTISNSTLAVVAGELELTGAGGSYPAAFQDFNCTIGKTYRVSLSLRRGTSTSNASAVIQTTASSNITSALQNGTTTNSTRTLTFVATATTHRIALFIESTTGTGTIYFDNVSVREFISDRSYKASTANINGTLTRSQLASGTSLVGYSGWSASNYLREPYSVDLDFGTGEFSASAWVNTTYAAPGNLTTNSNTFSSWQDGAGFTRQADLITVPDGNQYAIKFLCTSTGVEDGGILKRNGANPSGTTVSFYVQDIGVGKRIFCYDNSGGVVSFNSYFSFTTKSFTNLGTQVITTSYEELPNNWYRLMYHLPLGNANYLKLKYENLAVNDVMHVFGHQIERTLTASTYKPSGGSVVVVNSPICSREFSIGPRIQLSVNSYGQLSANVFDGTTTRTVTTTAAYNTATWINASANYTTDGSLAIQVNGREVAVTRGTPLLSLNSRYNILTHSEEFNNLTWNIPNVTLLPNQLGPGSSNNGTQITFTTDGGTGIRRTSLNGLGSGLTNILSAALKYGTWRWFEFTTVRSGVATRSWIDLQNGVAGTTNHIGFTVTPANNGWIRFSAQIGSTGVDEIYVTPRNSNGDAANAIGNNGATIFATEFDIRPLALAALLYQRVGTTVTDFDFQAPLTIGNSYSLDAPFPGSIALLKLSATVPTTEQSIFMYEQEKQLFRPGALSVLPDSTSIVDMSYDDATDRWSTVSATNESYWTGLVRNSVTTVPAGSYSKITTTSGIELTSRTTTNPGVDVSIPTYLLREDLNKRAEAASKAFKEIVNFDYVGGFTASTTTGSTAITSVANLTYPVSPVGARISGAGIPTNATIVAVSGTTIYISAAATATATGVSISFLDFELPTGFEAETVSTAGAIRREGTTADFTRLFDGFIETIRFAVAPGSTTWVQIQASRIIS